MQTVHKFKCKTIQSKKPKWKVCDQAKRYNQNGMQNANTKKYIFTYIKCSVEQP